MITLFVFRPFRRRRAAHGEDNAWIWSSGSRSDLVGDHEIGDGREGLRLLPLLAMGGCLSFVEPRLPPIKKPVKLRKAASDVHGVVSVLAPPKDVEDLRLIGGYGNVNRFAYGELRAATKNFRPDQILGEGGFGIVYKGVIDKNVRPGFKSTYVAVKELNPDGSQGDKEWLAEVNYLGQLSHPNLVKLIGYYCEKEQRLLVYEYMACSSLERHLFQWIALTMPWSTRMKIALGAAKGLAFLHGLERSIIYRDCKTSNICINT